MPDLFQEAATRRPEAVAVRDADSTWTYGELARRVGRWAARLRRAGVGRETPVGIAIDRSAEMLCGVLAAMKAGGSYVPVDPALPAERIAGMAEDGGIEIFLTQERTLDRLPRNARAIAVDRDRAALEAEGPLAPDDLPAPGDRCYVLFTSGSTGRPKGVECLHRSLTNVLLSVVRLTGFGAADTFLATSSLSFDVATAELLLPLLEGGSVWVARRSDLDDPERFGTAFERSACTFLAATPSGWKMLLRMGWKGRPGLTMFTAGEPIPRDLAAALAGCGKALWNLYGPTEATVYATWWKVDPASSTMRIGRPLDGVEVRVVGGGGEPLPRGEIGELWIGGVGVARGYLHRPELTAERFAGGWYRTGDLARLPEDGELEYLGRRDDQVKIRGYRIELGEIEVALRAHPSIADAVVVKRPDAEGGDKLVGYFTARRAAAPAVDPSIARVFDAVYDDAGDADARIQVGGSRVHSGYRSSYTGRPMPVVELDEMIRATVRRLLALRPRRVLEIGCGVGALAIPLAASCERYVGSDFSARAIDFLRGELARQSVGHAEVSCREAIDLDHAERGGFDLVVVNSVIQYFPDVEYVRSVLREASLRLAPGGCLFVGEVRSAALWEVLLADVLRSRSPGLSDEALAARIALARRSEKELLFHPEFWHAIAAELPRVDRVRVELREGRFDDEISRFRYDVFLHVDPAPAFRDDRTAIDWRAGGLTLDAVEARLRAPGGEGFVVQSVPNARIPGRAGVHPDRFRELAARHGWSASIPWSRSGEPGDYDVELAPPGARGYAPSESPDRYGSLSAPPAYASRRRDVRQEARLAHELREWLARSLPEYMIPSQLIGLEEMPTNANGKVDKSALPPPENVRPQLDVPYVEPRGEDERWVCERWEAQLGVRPVGALDGYFDLGGHSISALSFTVDLEARFGARISVVDFLRGPTPENVVRLVRGGGGQDPRSPIVTIHDSGDRAPFFCVHGAGGRTYMLVDFAQHLGTSRPVHLIQDPAYSYPELRKDSIRDLAATYVKALRQVQPRGPYNVGGICFGSVVVYEMAQQLREAGEDVPLLTMIDPVLPNEGRKRPGLWMKTKEAWQILTGFIPYMADEAYVTLTAKRRSRGPGGRLETWIYEFARARSVLAKILPENSPFLTMKHPEFSQMSALVNHHMKIWDEYWPDREWAGPVLFVATSVPTTLTMGFDDDLYGWTPYLKGPIERRVVEGADHFTLGRRPHSVRLAGFLKEAFERLDRGLAGRVAPPELAEAR